MPQAESPPLPGLTLLLIFCVLHPCPQEESGEPLTCLSGGTWYLLGMVSWGAGCSKSEAPPIYLQVSSYHKWIWDIINNQQPRSPPAPSRARLLALLLPLSLLPALCH